MKNNNLYILAKKPLNACSSFYAPEFNYLIDDGDINDVAQTEEKITQEDIKEEENTESDASVIITGSTRPKGLSKKGELR